MLDDPLLLAEFYELADYSRTRDKLSVDLRIYMCAFASL